MDKLIKLGTLAKDTSNELEKQVQDIDDLLKIKGLFQDIMLSIIEIQNIIK